MLNVLELAGLIYLALSLAWRMTQPLRRAHRIVRAGLSWQAHVDSALDIFDEDEPIPFVPVDDFAAWDQELEGSES